MDERAVNELRQLAALDAELAESASGLRGLDATVAALRRRAEAIDAFFADYPEELAAPERGAEGRPRRGIAEARGAGYGATDAC